MRGRGVIMTDQELLEQCARTNAQLRNENADLREQLEASEKQTLYIQLVYMIILAAIVIGAVALFG